MIQSKQEAAVEIASELRWPVFPCWWAVDGKCTCGDPDCGNPGKHPLGKLAPHGLKNATTTLDVVSDWWKRFPKANVAVKTGDSCWVLDLDGLDGIRAFGQLAETRDDLPEVPVTITGGGGKHLFFSPDGRIRNGAKIGGMSIDVRASGGYVLIPPSDHALGTTYRWELPATKYDLAPAPGWLIDFVLTGSGTGNGTGGAVWTMTGDFHTQPGAEKGERNDILCRLVGTYLREHGATAELFDFAVAWGRRCRPPMSEGQVRKTVMALAWIPTGPHGPNKRAGFDVLVKGRNVSYWLIPIERLFAQPKTNFSRLRPSQGIRISLRSKPAATSSGLCARF